MKKLLGTPRKKLEQWLAKHNLPLHHCKTLMKSMYLNLNPEAWTAEGLPKSLQSICDPSMKWEPFATDQVFESGYDSSCKFLFTLDDGSKIESVLMPEKSRLTLCVSTQVGCRQACSFCHTGKMGLIRQMTTEEILNQVMTINHWLTQNSAWLKKLHLDSKLRVTNLVFMGMGEPLDNWDALDPALSILCDPWGFSLAPRRVTVSTAGFLPGLEKLEASEHNVCLAFSLHTPDSLKRSQLMPINRRYPLDELIVWFKQYTDVKKRHILIQYTLIDKVNDSQTDAINLAKLLHGVRCKINVIPLNPIEPSRLQAPDSERLKSFIGTLFEKGFRTNIRYSKGQDIAAACGQLSTKQA